jgi:uncharacterized protein
MTEPLPNEGANHPGQPRRVVLDTNVCLDLWLFDQPSVATLRAALDAQRIHPIATSATRDELAHVLARRAALTGPAACRWMAQTSAPTVLQRWCDAHGMSPDADDTAAPQHEALPITTTPLSLTTTQCTDPDDQKFIDLAIHQRVDALLTRDKAVLKLARRLQAHGVVVATPERWWSVVAASLAVAASAPTNTSRP